MSCTKMTNENENNNTLNIEPLMLEIENVIKQGLQTILKEFIDRHELLERTHQQIMNLPSVLDELNRSENTDTDTKNSKQEYEIIFSILNKISNKLQSLDGDVKLLQKSSNQNTHIHINEPTVQPCEKENIKLEINDLDLEEEEEEEQELEDELEQELVEDEEVVDEEEEELEDEEEELVEEDEQVVLEEEELVEDEQEEEDEVETEAEEEAEDDSDIEIPPKEEEEEEELFEIEIDDVTYCTNNEENGFIYELTSDGEVGNKVGYLKEGEPFFYADEIKIVKM